MTARQQLEKFLAKYEPSVAVMAKKALGKMRKLVPGANEMVYDNYNALVIGFVPGERPSEVVFSIAVYPSYANLFFAQGKGLPDPGGAGSSEGADRSEAKAENRNSGSGKEAEAEASGEEVVE